MGRLGWLLLVTVVYVLHQDVWLWRSARPLFFGFLPVGLAWHAAYCIVVAVLMWGLTTFAWPAHLEPGPEAEPGATGSAQGGSR